VPEPATFTGWGRTAPVVAHPVRVDASEVAAVLRAGGSRGTIARGLGRSYGDAAQNSGGQVLLPLEGEPRMEGAHVVVPAGVSLHQLMGFLVRTGRFLPVTPGTRFVSVGGAIACDVHGKSHHVAGSFGAHVVSFDLVTPDGNLRRVTPEGSPELFWATTGGMGLTGVITSATLRTMAIESGWVSVTTERFPDLGSVMAAMGESDADHTYSVAWLDTLTRGSRLGRAVLTRGEHATREELTGRAARMPYPAPTEPRLAAPAQVPSRLVSRPSVRLFNELWFRKAPARRSGELQTLAAFFHPLDGVAHWNRVYGPHGFVQYQFVVPDEAREVVRRVVARLADGGHPSFLSVLKRFGAANPGPLSFPMAGWTLAVDLPASPSLAPVLDELDDLVADAGGRVYLAKDSRLPAYRVAAMYPRVEEFRKLRRTLDPDRRLASDLARRLEL
jgi:decaprenylphospho-beta-D-ribofuranose 2-oxidase